MDLESIRSEALSRLNNIQQRQELADWYHSYLGRKGAITNILRELSNIEPEQRRTVGQAANKLRNELDEQFKTHQEYLIKAEIKLKAEQESLDVTLPGRRPQLGHFHLLSQMLHRIEEIFSSMGFFVYNSPEVETEEYNFDLLNIPEHHPARDMWDTFWSEQKTLLRTHTSPGQIRCMQEHNPNPIRVILPGKCYRYENVTTRSEHQFYQVEGMAIGKNIRLTDLIGTIKLFAQKMFGSKRQIRIRGSYFPFTEPSIEIDMDCILCNQSGCRICKHSGWLEIAGAGMMHPAVLKNGGYDPQQWTGFAFGVGVERPAMLIYGIEDIRYFYQNDLRFNHQF